jgi:23S rRNA-intervening sequence protein
MSGLQHANADGEQTETQHWIETALDCEYIDQKTSAQLVEGCLEIGHMLGGMMDKAELFCGQPPRTLREESAIYYANSADTETDN